MGHRSLLTCFESTHSVDCAVCLRSAAVAHRMQAKGTDLEAIRRAIDEMFVP